MTLRTEAVICKLVLLVVAGVLACSHSVFAGSPGEWNQDIARQLVAEGWEYAWQQESPMILYGIQVVALERESAAFLELAFKGETVGEESYWTVNASPELLQVLAGDHLAIDFHGQSQDDLSYLENLTWLGTVLEKPVSVSSTQGSPTNGGQRNRFELHLTPQTLGYAERQVETRMVLDYESEGNMTQMESTAWVGFDKPCPIALVSFAQTEKGLLQKKYFALYLRATVVPLEAYPQDSALLRMGNLHPLSDLLDQMLSCCHDEKENVHLIHFGLTSNREGFGYQVQYTGLLSEGLGFTVLVIGNPGEPRPLIYFGAVDQMEWDNGLMLRASLLPFTWDTVRGEVRREICAGLELGLTRGRWGVNLGMHYLDHSWKHSASLQYRVSDKAAWEVGGSIQVNRSLVTTGLTLKL